MRLKDRVAIVTGGASGIGEASVRRFIEEGARVLIADLNPDRGSALADELGSDAAAFLKVDVSKEADVAAAVDAAVDRWGSLDIMFNNAGFGGALGPIESTSVDDYDLTMDVLLKGVFLGIKHATRVMRPAGSGNVINTASVAGLLNGWAPHLYNTAKAAVIQLTKSASLELADYGIRCNCICPGVIATPLATGLPDATPEQVDKMRERVGSSQVMGRIGDPVDIANAAVFLASDEAGFITGHAQVVDGGTSIGRPWRRQGGWITKPNPIVMHRPDDR